MDHVALDHQVLVDELGRVGVVGVDAAYLGGSEIDLVDALALEEGTDGGLVGQIKFGVGAGDQVGVALGLQCRERWPNRPCRDGRRRRCGH